ncbi:hypothetical protein [Brevundimonas sp.]|uniref:hypothetical protein n=1 Tax=Brevundimonas sp. TaxID=1871086 RepID=UPI0025CCC600|nr:hypothetical protein [Brevundimonas sp.]
MFDFGKDLQRWVASGGRAGVRDARLLELLGPDLLAQQAHAETGGAERSNRPVEGWRDVCRLWLEHARRTGSAASLDAAERASERCLALAEDGSGRATGLLARARVAMTRHELFAGPDTLVCAELAVDGAGAERSAPEMLAQIAGIHARLAARRAQASGTGEAIRSAAALLDSALHDLEVQAGQRRPRDPWITVDLTETRLERAALGALAGVRHRDPRLLDQAGRDLRLLAERTDGDFAPLTRARALAACGAGLAVLGEMAERADAVRQAVELLDAAADLFPADHSPLDHAAILAARGSAQLRLSRMSEDEAVAEAAAEAIDQAWRLTTGRRLKLGAEIAALNTRARIDRAEHEGDLIALSTLEARARARLAEGGAEHDPLGWAVDQLALAEVYEALERLGASPSRAFHAATARAGAAEVFEEEGMAGLARA